mmetsp:Transcript_27215/g.73122  ORF Transcript_27215/g.73122 Transcript_27215/m.73122 type:complete len:224 (+) Transcript_27215:5582-6253(+)
MLGSTEKICGSTAALWASDNIARHCRASGWEARIVGLANPFGGLSTSASWHSRTTAGMCSSKLVPAAFAIWPIAIKTGPRSALDRNALMRYLVLSGTHSAKSAGVALLASLGSTASTALRTRRMRVSLNSQTHSNTFASSCSSSPSHTSRSCVKASNAPCAELLSPACKPRTTSSKTRAYHCVRIRLSLSPITSRHARRASDAVSRTSGRESQMTTRSFSKTC